MPSNWNKGLSKFSHPSVKKISETMKKRKLDNFRVWRERMKEEGKIKSEYPSLDKNGDLAELIGVILGDGYLGKMARTEELTIACNSKNIGMIQRYAVLVERIFKKRPYLQSFNNKKCVKIRIYEKNISVRLGIPYGAKRGKIFKIPYWVKNNKFFIIRYLRGLYEAEGSFSVHKPTSTYKLQFCNTNKSLRDIVYKALTNLGFKVNVSGSKVQISRQKEVYAAKELLHFRDYENIA